MLKRLIKGFAVVALLLFTILVFVFLWLARPLEKSSEDINALCPNHLIAHAGGAIDGHWIYMKLQIVMLCVCIVLKTTGR